MRDTVFQTQRGRMSSMAGSKAKAPGRAFRMQIAVNIEEAAAVTDYQFAKRLPSKSAAVRQLLQRGMSVTVNSRYGSRHRPN
jgi:hypothetical protein